jgi:hypothetical protein
VETMTRTPKNIYILNEIEEERCCLGKEDEVDFNLVQYLLQTYFL